MRKLAFLPVASALLCACISVGPEPAPHRSPAPVPVVPSAPPEPVAIVTAPEPVAPRPAPVPAAVRIDNTSLTTFRATWQELYRSLSPTERAGLNDAASRIAFSGYHGETQLPLNLRNSPIVPEMIRDRIDGLTYPQIIELAKRMVNRSKPTSP